MGVIIVIVLAAFVIISITTDIAKDKAKREQEAEIQTFIQESENKYSLKRKEYETKLSELQNKYGNCSAEINLSGWDEYSISDSFLVFEESKIVVIENIPYKFSMILGYTLVDDSTETTQTLSEGGSQSSTGSVIGRSIVGGLVGGGIGALAGATTAKRNTSTDSITTTTKSQKYVIYINLDSIDTPTIKLTILNRDKAYKIANILNVIIKRNEQPKV